jgi:chromosomal replication initiation ATPase DnaA
MYISPIHLIYKANNYDVCVVIKEFAELIDAKPNDLIKQDRSQTIARCRHVLIFSLKLHTGLSYPKIGLIMKRDHSTIIHAVKMGEKIVKENPFLYDVIEKIFDKAEWPKEN